MGLVVIPIPEHQQKLHQKWIDMGKPMRACGRCGVIEDIQDSGLCFYCDSLDAAIEKTKAEGNTVMLEEVSKEVLRSLGNKVTRLVQD